MQLLKNRKGALRTAYAVILTAVITGVVVGGAVYYYAVSLAPAGPKKWKIGYVTYPFVDAWAVASETIAKWYAEDHHDIMELYTVVGSPEWTGLEQVKKGKELIEAVGVDGIVISAENPTVLKSLVDYATENNVPCMAYDVPVDSPDLLLYVGIANFDLGKEAAVKAREIMIEERGEVAGKVVVLVPPPEATSYRDRYNGYKSVWANDTNIEIVELGPLTVHTIDNAKKTVGSYLAAGNDFDVAWSYTGGTNIGIVQALLSEEMDPSEKILVASDAYPLTLDYIELGYMKGSTDQPVPYYAAICMKYMIDYLEGKSIPGVGDTITAADLDIEGEEHYGFDPWGYDEEIYLPAEVVDWKSNIARPENWEYTFPWFHVGVAVIDETNADLPGLWGNFPVKWEEAVIT